MDIDPAILNELPPMDNVSIEGTNIRAINRLWYWNYPLVVTLVNGSTYLFKDATKEEHRLFRKSPQLGNHLASTFRGRPIERIGGPPIPEERRPWYGLYDETQYATEED